MNMQTVPGIADLQARLSAAEEALRQVEANRDSLLLRVEETEDDLRRAEAVIEAAKIFTTRYRYTPESNPLRDAIRRYEGGEK